MERKKEYIGPVTGRRYDLAAGEKIDPQVERLGYTGDKASPSAIINGREVYKRIFIRLRTPEEVLTHRPIENGADFAKRAAIIEQWYNNHVAGQNVLLLFEALEISEQDAAAIMADEQFKK